MVQFIMFLFVMKNVAINVLPQTQRKHKYCIYIYAIVLYVHPCLASLDIKGPFIKDDINFSIFFTPLRHHSY